MTYDARQVANWFIERAASEGRALSIMSLLKLVYIAHGWYLEMYDQPLISDKVEAWKYGPVIPIVYNEFRPQGLMSRKRSPNFPPIDDPDDTAFLEQIFNIYGGMSSFRLSEITHTPGGPWETATKWGGWYAEIPNELIKAHYVNKRQLANQAYG